MNKTGILGSILFCAAVLLQTSVVEGQQNYLDGNDVAPLWGGRVGGVRFLRLQPVGQAVG